jgi:hypothetical protein
VSPSSGGGILGWAKLIELVSGDGLAQSTGPNRVGLHLRTETEISLRIVVLQIKKQDDGYVQKLNNFISFDVITFAIQTEP